MANLTDEQVAQFLHRSYVSVDGLWFMKVEERSGFDEALETDIAVWKVLPKIQARMLKSMLGAGDGKEKDRDALLECFSAKLDLDGFEYEARADGDGIRICIFQCPWHNKMIKSGRGHLSRKVSDVMCLTEYCVWGSEFGGFKFERESRICTGEKECILRFLP